MKLAALVNPKSGSVPENAPDELEAAIREKGHDLIGFQIASDDLEAQAKELAKSDTDAAVVWGGDGTLACVLNQCGSTDLPVLVLPGGTMNMLPKRLHGQDNWKRILDRVLADPVTDALSAGEINGQRFYVAALLGQMTRLTEAREAVRAGKLVGAAQSLIENNALDLETRLKISTRRGAKQNDMDAVAAAVVLSDGRTPTLEIAAIDPDSTMDLIYTTLDAMIRGWREAGPVERDVTDQVIVCDMAGEKIPMTLDGEPFEASGSVEIRLVRTAARVLRAKDDQ